MAGKQKAIKPTPAMQGSIPFFDVPVPWPSARRISKQSTGPAERIFKWGRGGGANANALA